MSFATPWGLLALLGVPLVLWLHTLRRRLRERRVAGLFLFAPDALAEDAGRTRSPLLRTPSLWLELAACVLLALLLAGPRLGASPVPRHLVAVLDDTASMGATFEGTPVAERARRALLERMAAVPADGRVSLVLAGPRPEMLVGPRAPVPEAHAALRAWRPVRVAADPSPALDLALQLADPEDDVLFLTDVADPEVPPRVEVLAFGRAAANAALGSVRRGAAGPDREELHVDVVAFSDGPVPTVLTVEAVLGDAAREVGRKDLVVDPGRRVRVALEVPRSDAALRVRLTSDALPLDDEAVLLPEALRSVPYAVDVPEDAARALGLDRLEEALPGLRRVPPEEAALVVAHTEATPRAGTTRLVVAAAGEERDDWLGPFLLDRAHGLVEGLTLEGVVWSAGRETLPGRGLVFVGERAVLAEERGEGTTVRMNVDPARSTLALSADWPILLSNLVERVRASLPGAPFANARVGETLLYRARPSDALAPGWRWITPSGEEEDASVGTLRFHEPREPGTFRLASPSGEVARWSVAFVDGRESDLRDRGSALRPARRPPQRADARAPVEAAATTLPARHVALLVLVLATAAAWVLARRRARRPPP